MKSSRMPFRYDVGLERVVNNPSQEGSIYEDLGHAIQVINEFEPNLMGEVVFDDPTGRFDLGNDHSGVYVMSNRTNNIVEVSAGPNRDTFYVLVNSFDHTATIVNKSDIPNNLKLPNNQAKNLTLFTFTRVSDEQAILTDKLENMYGVQNGAFDTSDFIGMDFSIGDNIY